MEKSTSLSFDALFNYATMGIIVVDETGKIVLVNPYLRKQFNYSEEDLIGCRIEKLIPSRFHSKHVQHVDHYTERPKNRPMGLGMDLYAMRKDGSEFPVEVSLGNYETENGKFTIAFLSDISKRKEAENALIQLNADLENKIAERTISLTETVKQLAKQVEETETKDAELKRINNFLSNIWAHAEAIIYVTDQEGVIKMFNPTAEKSLGLSANDVINQLSPIFFHDPEELMQHANEMTLLLNQSIEPNFNLLAQKVNAGLTNEIEVIYVSQSGRRFPVSLTLTAMRNSSMEIEGYLGIAIDISERKKAEIDLRHALEKEKEVSELKSRFVSIASHEFRTPLSTVLSSAYLISKYTESNDNNKRDKHVQRIVSSVNMLTDILNDFLSVGKIEEGKIQVRNSNFNLPELIQNIIHEMNGHLKNNQTIIYQNDKVGLVTMDERLLKHIVMNLISNAIKFSPEKSMIKIDSKLEGSSIELSVEDNGIGIPEKDQAHLFERFFRGGNVTNIQGTGLGLHIVSKYAELMNGMVYCESEIDKGTRFKIIFDLTNNQNH
ncbi:MAG: PAS domain-containing sensor histidine kinase [Chitinophagaceae bacterium]|jgi:PAS domain S-box-containing protein